MYDGGCLSEPGQLQRAVGELRVAVKRFGAETVLDELRQTGCLKARFPRRIVPGWMDIVMLNTGGGVAGGDRLDVTIDVRPDAQATIAAQAAERIYRSRPTDPPSRVRTRLMVAHGGALEWLPQETILFDQSTLDRRLEIDLAADARVLCVETIVFGRAAMGERIGQGVLRDLIRVRRDGNLLLHDAIRIDGDIDAKLRHIAIGAGAAVVATIAYVAPDITARLEPLRQALAGPGEAAASAWNGMLLARILGRDSACVRHTVIAALTVLREDRPLPRVWLC
ncbi:MAG TPA: urease accessory protein UreD [Rhodopila sp.]|jgi:urease accessory protein